MATNIEFYFKLLSPQGYESSLLIDEFDFQGIYRAFASESSKSVKSNAKNHCSVEINNGDRLYVKVKVRGAPNQVWGLYVKVGDMALDCPYLDPVTNVMIPTNGYPIILNLGRLGTFSNFFGYDYH